MQHQVLLIAQLSTERFVDHHFTRLQRIGIGSPHINRQQFVTHRHIAIHQQPSSCILHQWMLQQSLVHEARTTGNDRLCPAQPFTDTLHQRAPHRVAQQQTTRQHRHHQNDSSGDQTIVTSVVSTALFR